MICVSEWFRGVGDRELIKNQEVEGDEQKIYNEMAKRKLTLILFFSEL